MGSFSQGGLISQTAIVTTSGATTTLTATSKPVQRFVGTLGQTVVMPDATTVKLGKVYYISNRSTGLLTINSSGGTFLRYANTQDLYQLTLVDNSSSAGVWDIEYSGSAVPLRMYGHPTTADSKLYISPNTLFVDNLPVTSTTPIKGSLPTVVASTIDFQTQATTGNTFSIVFPASTVGFYRHCGLTLLQSGTIQANFSTEAATVGALPDPAPLFVTGLPLGYVTLQCTNVAGLFKTANSSSNVIENSVAGVATVHNFTTSGGGSSTGSGIGDDLNSVLFRASFKDAFESFPDSSSPVDTSAGKTDSTLYSATNQYYRLNYEARRTANTVGTAVTIVGGLPSFTVKVGDYLIAGSQARRITAVGSQTSYTINSAFSPDLAGAAVCITQALYTKDINNFAGDGQAISSIYSSNIASLQCYYTDSASLNDTYFDTGTPNVAFVASSDNSNFTLVSTKPSSILDNNSIVSLPSSSTSLYLVFFANKVGTSTYGAVNLLSYRVFFQIQNSLDLTGYALNQAYCFTDGTGTEINCTAPYLLSGKTAVDLNFNWTVGMNTGQPNGQLQVFLNGQKIPRYVDAVITPDAYYKEIGLNTIQLDQDYSAANINLEIIKPVGVIDSNSQNAIDIAQIKANPVPDGTVTTPKIVDLNVTTGKINDLAVTGGKVADAAISYSKLAADVTSLFSAGYISNGSAEADTSGWSTYVNVGASPTSGTGGVANITWARSLVNPLRGVASFLLSKDGANRQGQGVATDFTIQNADLAKVLTISFDYAISSGTCAAGDIAVYLIQDPSGSPTIIQPTGYQVLSASIGTKMRHTATFQTDSTIKSYRLCFHVATPSLLAYALQIDNVVVNNQIQLYGPPVTDWLSYTPTFNGLGTCGTIECYYRRVGQNVEIKGRFLAGTIPASADEVRIGLPAGLSALSQSAINTCGLVSISRATAINEFAATVRSGYTYITVGPYNGVTHTPTSEILSNQGYFSNTDTIGFWATVPILGWSSTVQMSNDTDTRVVAMFASKNGNLAIAANSTAVTSWTVVNDTHGTFNGVTGVYTIPVSGWYEFGGRYTLIGTSGYYGNLVNINGAGQEFIGNYVQSDRVGSSTIRYLLAGNTLIPGIYSSSIAGTLVSAACDFWVKRVSGPSAIAASESVVAKYTNAAGTLIQNNVLTVVPFATKVYDSHGSFDGSTYTVPVSGKYRITAAMHTNSLNVTNTHYISYTVYKTGSPDTQLFAWMAQANSPGPTNLIANGSTTISCSAGDLLTIRATGGNGINNATLSGSTVQNYMCIERVGN